MKEDPEFRPKKFAVIGAGPVGCIVAAFLAKGGYEVILCDVVTELTAAVEKEGITIEGAENLHQRVARTCNMVDELAEDPPDVVVVTVKANALPLLSSALDGIKKEGMYVISWQNGIDTELVLAQTLGKKPVLRAVVNYGCGLKKPAHVVMPFHHTPHFLQELDPQSKNAALAIAGALTASGLTTQRTDQIVSMVWRKSIMNACMNPVCAVTGMTMAQAMADPIVFQIIDALVKECVEVARANEISVGWDFYPYCMGYMKSAGNHKPSMLMDIENKRLTEIDYINGQFIKYGEQAGMATPYNRTMRALVKALESKR